MNFIKSFNLLGVEAQQIPCITGEGVPTTATEGAIGCFYMDTTSGEVYKCTNVANGIYTWVLFEGANKEGEITSLMTVPRATFKQIRAYDKEKNAFVYFEEIYTYCHSDDKHGCGVMFGLEQHKSNSTEQSIYKSVDGGETWELFGTFPIDATNGVWYFNLFIDVKRNIIIMLKTTNGHTRSNNQLCTFVHNGTAWYHSTTKELGNRIWLENSTNIDVCTTADWSKRVIIFGEYQTTTDGSTSSLWRSTDGGLNWTNVLEITANSTGADGKVINGDIRHWHTVQADPYTKHWWATSGDTDKQCKMYRSTDDGLTWELMFSGSQRERTCRLIFEEDCIYYGMDSTNNADENSIKIVKIDRAKLETDRENCREDVATVNNAYSVYSLTRTYNPDGFIVWSMQEGGASFIKDTYVLQFYDYVTKKLYPIAYFDISNIPQKETKFIGFHGAQKRQDYFSGNIIAKPNPSLQQEKYNNFTSLSTCVKVNLSF